MKVLFHTSLFQFQKGNGGKTVFLKTREALERLGVRVDLFDQWRADIAGYDVVHCFTLETTDMWAWVKASEGRLAVSPISWFGVYATRRSRAIRWAKRQLRSKLKCPLHEWWEDYFRYPDVYFPQSQVQADQLATAFGVARERIAVVPHGVDERFAEASPVAFKDRFRREDFVLCVARFEPRKNQLGLIRALRGSGLPLVFVGRPDNAAFAGYYRECVREAGDTALFIDDIEHDSDLMRSAYAAARVLVLPSYLEFPGLTALEAGLAGSQVAVTAVGCAREYLGEHAGYLDPSSEASIRRVVLDRFQAARGPNTALQDHIRKNFLWPAVARRHLEAYERLLTGRRTS
jgi:glycosyltransferase involved in cell wall biosynthesis